MSNWSYTKNKLSNGDIIEHSIIYSKKKIKNKNFCIDILKINDNQLDIKLYFIGHKEEIYNVYMKFDDGEYVKYWIGGNNFVRIDCFDLIHEIKNSKKLYIKTDINFGKVFNVIDDIQEVEFDFDVDGLDFTFTKTIEIENKLYKTHPIFYILTPVLYFLFLVYYNRVTENYISPLFFYITIICAVFLPDIITFFRNSSIPKYSYEVKSI